MNTETQTELDQLEHAALAVDAMGEQAAPGAPAAEAPAADPAAEVAGLLQTVAAMLSPMFPSLAEIYTTQTCAALGQAAAPVMAKHGLSMGGIFERWGAEIALLGAALPVGIATAHGIKADLAAKKPKPAEAAPQGVQVQDQGQGAVMVVG